MILSAQGKLDDILAAYQ